MIENSFARFVVARVCASLFLCLPAAASHLVTGNGFGFAVVSPESATVTKFYAHPYSFVRPDAKNPLSEGVETANFINALRWGNGTSQIATTEYADDSHIIHARTSDGEAVMFMPFGLRQAALIISWKPSEEASQGG